MKYTICLFTTRAGWRVLADLWRSVSAAHRSPKTTKQKPMRVWVLKHHMTGNGKPLFAVREMVGSNPVKKVVLTDAANEAAQFLTRREARSARRDFPAEYRRKFRTARHTIREGGEGGG